jgi:predicted phage baseplate assembly protein
MKDDKLNTCGCCEGIAPRTSRYNRPGKSAIDYRLDTHGMFLRRMIARLPTQSVPDGRNAGSRPLSALAVRSTDDPAIAMLDAWAVIADVLTFYQERIANECFLRTATERRSVLELARAIGYELKPGVAASTYLAFTLEDVPGAPGHAIIDKGIRVMSVPGQDEKPQIFETIEWIEARAEWNALKPRMTEPKTPGLGAKEVYQKGVTRGLKPGDWLLFVGEERELDPGSERWDFRQVKTVTADPEAGHTKVTWEEGLGWKRGGRTIQPAQENLKVYAFRQRAALFGHNAPDWRAMADSVKAGYLTLGLYAEYFDSIDLISLKVTRIDPQVKFDWETGSPDPEIPPNNFSARWTGLVKPTASGTYTFYTWSDDGARLWVNGQLIINNWTDHAPMEDSGTITLAAGQMYDIRLEYYERYGGATIKLSWSGPTQPKEIIPQSQLYPHGTYDEWPGFTVSSVGTRRGLYAEFFDNIDLTNRKVTRIDPQVNFDWGTGSPDPVIPSDNFSARWTGLVEPKSSGVYTFYTFSDDGVRLWVNGQQIINNWADHSPTWNSGNIQLEAGRSYDIRLEYYERGGGATIKLWWSGPNQPKEIIPQSQLYPPDVHLDAVYSQILPGSWLVLSSPNDKELYQVEAATEDSRSNFTLTAKTTRVTLKGENLSRFNNKLRETAVFAQSELLEMAEVPILDPITGSSIKLDRKVDGLTKGQLLMVSGRDESGESRCEVMTLIRTEPGGDATEIFFTQPLVHRYRCDTVTINANVARATHGETVHEVLGSGSAAESHLRFALKKSPLTYISAPTPSGTLSTLNVSVNGIQWQEVPSLYGLDRRSQSYIVRIDDDGRTSITFGDGRNGARLPTGMENVTAVYRSGIGHDGEVGAGSLTILQTRPLGVRSVTNPLPASGAESPEKLSDARRNAPVTVLTLDRIVSLLDFENLTRSFAGIGKAQALALKVGLSQIVHITVAAANGSKVEGEPLKNLRNAIAAVRDPIEHVEVDSFQLRTFSIEAGILVDPRYLAEDVLAEVENALRNTFSFENRDFGQPVTAAEVLSIMQAVEGVVAVDLNTLKLDQPSDISVPSMRINSMAGTSSTPGMSRSVNIAMGGRVFPQFYRPIKHVSRMSGLVSPSAILTSEKAQVKGGNILPAELLLLNPAAGGVDLEELKT